MIRAALLLPILLTTQPGSSQVPWKDLRQEQRWRKGSDHQFRLVLRNYWPLMKAWKLQEDGARLEVSGAMTVMTPSKDDMAALLAEFPGLGKPDWLALGPEGDVLISGQGEPDVPGLMAAFRATGWRPRWEVRAEFLRDHPEHGEALAEELRYAVGMVGNRAWSLARPTPRQSSPYDGFTAEDWDQAGIGQVRDALEALLRVPGWEDAEYFDYFHGIEMYRTSPQLQPTLTRLIGRLRDMVRQNPSDYRGWEMLGRLSSMLPAGFADALTEGLESVPGTSGTEEVVPGLACGFYIRIQDWPGLERYTAERWSRVLARPLSASPALRRAELSVILPVLRVGIPRVQALVMLGRAGEARSVLQECRHLSGSHWSNLAPEIARQATRWDPKQERPAAVLQEILDLPPVESPPQPKPEPFRLVLAMASGGPAKLKQFQTDPLFADWRSDELNWGMLGEEERALLRDVWPLGQVHGWALLQGRRVLETGLEPPSVERVAAALSRHGEPQADLVRRFLKQEPDRLDAQQRYISLLEPLLPNARLEADLLPRLQAWGLGLVNQGSYRPAGDPEAWSAAALRVLPRLEAGLERRPQSGRLWNRWMFWSQFHPRSAKPHTLLSGLPILPVTSPAGSLLNINILHRVVEALRQRKAWTDLAAWCAAVWELDQRRRLAAVINRPTGIRSGYADPLGELREVRDLVLKPWEEALIQMGGTARLKQLQGELKAMGYKDPGPRPRELN